jgi:hypothetical protein
MSPAARQLCRASGTVNRTDETLRKCPVCGNKMTGTFATVKVFNEGVWERRAVVPTHIRDVQGEMQVELRRAQHKYPGSGYPERG